MIKKLLGMNWRTSIGGIVACIGIVATQFSYLLDSDPSTKFNFDLVWAQLIMIAGILQIAFSARDAKVTSEKMGL